MEKAEHIKETYALITGGSQGIGRSLGVELAKRGHNLLLVALPEPQLDATADEIAQTYGVKVRTLGIDLSQEEAPEQTYRWCKDHNYTVDVLINNAGIAGTGVFAETSPVYSDKRIMVNIRALVLLSRFFIPDLKLLPKAYILNTGSLSAYYSIPYKSVYAASKAFVLSFSKALRGELKGTSVSVSVVNPNGVYANENVHNRIKAHGLKGKLTAISSEELASIAIDGMYKGKSVIIPKNINKFLLFLQKLIPDALVQEILLKEFNKEIKAKVS